MLTDLKQTSRTSAYAKVDAFLPHIDALQESFMVLETEANAGGACPCGCQEPAMYRCCECFDASALCSGSIVSRHQLHPFHQIQSWTGTYFDTCTLKDLGLVICLGHGGARCPASCEVKEMVVVHTNGIHQCSLRFCDCNDIIQNFQQLMRSRLFPATVKFPATVFTFELLETFHQLTLCSKITPYDYFDTLKKLTNIAFPQDVEVRYSSILLQIVLIILRTATRS